MNTLQRPIEKVFGREPVRRGPKSSRLRLKELEDRTLLSINRKNVPLPGQG
jgi:hypothetical protein